MKKKLGSIYAIIGALALLLVYATGFASDEDVEYAIYLTVLPAGIAVISILYASIHRSAVTLTISILLTLLAAMSLLLFAYMHALGSGWGP